MSLALSLATLFGKPAAERLIQALGTRKDGSKRLEQAATAMASGATAIEALKQAFGKDFLATVNEVLVHPRLPSPMRQAPSTTSVRTPLACPLHRSYGMN